MAGIRISDSELFELTENVCVAFLGLAVRRAEAGLHLDDTQSLTACVLIAGDWCGALTVRVSERLARTVAAEMFAMGIAELSSAEVQDALGEVANMIGGNVKGLVEGACTLSLPTIAEGQAHRTLVPSAKPVQLVSCLTEGEPLFVSVLERPKKLEP